MANRLAKESSPYLRSAAGSPIHWLPWGEEAFAQARKEDKPILLDIGAVWCHWCHVMDHGTYEDDEVVRRLNQDFVCIKVDRDERPDVDSRYQRAVGAITGQGGWPLTAFLDPQGRVFYGGTYFAAESAHGRPGFRDVLRQIITVYKDDRERVDHSAGHIAEALARHAQEGAGHAVLEPATLGVARAALVREHDNTFGGFGGAPKFPHTSAIALALTLDGTKAGDLRRIATHTLDKMAAGGIHDHVGGGFHRYSVDAHWTVPHFEKMAYDNAELLRVYAQAYAVTGTARYREVAEGIIDWTLEVCADREQGGFAASQDADHAPGDDGDYFTWTLAEVEAALQAPDEDAPDAPEASLLLRIAKARFGLEERGDMHHDPARNVLEHETGIDELATETGLAPDEVRRAERLVLQRLKRARDRRPTPFVDHTRYTDWNAMYASAFLEAGALLDRPDATRHALKTLDRIVATAWDATTGWSHRPRDTGDTQGFLDDQAWMGIALVDAYRFAARADLLDKAEETATVLGARWAAPEGGFFDIAETQDAVAEPLTLRHRPFLDQSGPGENPTAARFLMRLARATGRDDLLDQARRALEWCAADAPRSGVFAATWSAAVDELLSDPPVVTIFGSGDDPETQDLLAAVRAVPRTGLIVIHAEPGGQTRAPAAIAEALGNEDLIKEGPQMLVCRGDRCDTITRDIEDVRARLLSRPRHT